MQTESVSPFIAAVQKLGTKAKVVLVLDIAAFAASAALFYWWAHSVPDAMQASLPARWPVSASALKEWSSAQGQGRSYIGVVAILADSIMVALTAWLIGKAYRWLSSSAHIPAYALLLAAVLWVGAELIENSLTLGLLIRPEDISFVLLESATQMKWRGFALVVAAVACAGFLYLRDALESGREAITQLPRHT